MKKKFSFRVVLGLLSLIAWSILYYATYEMVLKL